MSTEQNVLGEPLQACCTTIGTGFYRDGVCRTGPQDRGRHVICSIVTDAFLTFSRQRGNDLITPMPAYRFPGLKAGDRWCLCASRWREAFEAGCAPRVDLAATDISALKIVPLDALKTHAIDH